MYYLDKSGQRVYTLKVNYKLFGFINFSININHCLKKNNFLSFYNVNS